VFKKYKKRQQIKFNKKVSKYLLGRSNEVEFNPLLTNMPYTQTDNVRYGMRLLENKAWYSGEVKDLSRFYTQVTHQQRTTKDEVSASFKTRRFNSTNADKMLERTWFWATAFINNSAGIDSHVRYTIGVAPKIPSTMATLVIGNGYDYLIELENASEEENDEALERLDYILNENSFDKLLRKALETESWAGGVAFKISFHKEFDTPVLEVISPLNYKSRKIANRVVEDIFQTFYKKDENTYKLQEIYGVDNEGAYIKFKLEEIGNFAASKEEDWIEVPLDTIEETAGFEDIHIKGYFKRLSIYKPNKAINNQFPDSLMGESDFSGSYAALNNLDEIYSTWAQELRDAKLQRYMPDTLADTDEEGIGYHPDFLKTTHIMLKGGVGQDADDKVEYKQGNINTDKHLAGIKQNYQIILNNAGLSPLTFGITGLEAMNSGEASQHEREKVSIRTRNDKVQSMEYTLNTIMPILFDVDQLEHNLMKEEEGSLTAVIKPSEVTFTFKDYIVKTMKDRTLEAQIGLESGSWDLKFATSYVHEDMPEDEQVLLRVNSKIEHGIGTFSKEEELIYLKYIQDFMEEDGQALEDTLVLPEPVEELPEDQFKPKEDTEEETDDEEKE